MLTTVPQHSQPTCCVRWENHLLLDQQLKHSRVKIQEYLRSNLPGATKDSNESSPGNICAPCKSKKSKTAAAPPKIQKAKQLLHLPKAISAAPPKGGPYLMLHAATTLVNQLKGEGSLHLLRQLLQWEKQANMTQDC
jgi:hypothetical protein